MAQAPNGMITVEEFAELKNMTHSTVISMICNGTYVGRNVENEWFIDSAEINGGSPAKSNSTVTIQSNGTSTGTSTGTSNEVVVTDIRMPFISMVIFMIKWVIAVIPALIILFCISLIFTAVLGVSIRGIIG